MDFLKMISILSPQAYMYKTVHLQCTTLVKHVGTLDEKLHVGG